jgi:hypothetical protein
MTKNAEIQWLKSIIANVPANSYLAMMLNHLLPQFESDVRSDLPTRAEMASAEANYRLAVEDMAGIQKKIDEARAVLNSLNEQIRIESARLQTAEHVHREAVARCQNLGSTLIRVQ